MQGYCFIDQPRTGALNMAMDQSLAQLAGAHQVVLLRLYQWAQPTLSLGYFQSLRERCEHWDSLPLPLVRRATGGGAIIHHFDWTYSLAVPDRPIRVGPSIELYDAVHDALVKLLRSWGYSAEKWNGCEIDAPGPETEPPGSCKSFLCFERRSSSDIVVGNQKVVGSAQRRVAGGLIQHGSMLLQTSEFAPTLVGLSELPRVADARVVDAQSNGWTNRSERMAQANAEKPCGHGLGQEIARSVSQALAEKWGWEWSLTLPEALVTELAKTVEGKFCTLAWNGKR